MAKTNIVNVLKRKSADIQNPWTDFPIGPEQKFISALRKSNNNNLEEQFLIGVDKRIITTTEDYDLDDSTVAVPCQHDHIIYKNDNDNTLGYYILDSYTRKDTSNVSSGENPVSVDTDALMFNALNLVQVDGIILRDLKGNGFMTYADNSLLFNGVNEVIVRKDILKFKPLQGNDIEISVKTTTLTKSGDTVSLIETIENKLAERENN